MSYFDELEKSFEKLSRWLSLRHEQGRDVQAHVDQLASRIKAMTGELIASDPASEMAKREPNDRRFDRKRKGCTSLRSPLILRPIRRPAL